MKIILVRHYKVDITHKAWKTAEEYSEYCNRYNIRPVLDQTPPVLPDYRLYSSSMQRAKDTAFLITGRQAEELEGVYEVTFNGFLKGKRKLPFWLWELLARAQWFLNNPKQKETLRMTRARLEKASDYLIQKNENCIVVMHSIAMKVMSRVLIAKGFKGKKILYVKNGEAVLFEK
ncbi:MAG: phosphoglycerate mutase family protein [Bacillota bacterium]|nr:phosphoglycerate mutase family protein [Bacillota bacterium]